MRPRQPRRRTLIILGAVVLGAAVTAAVAWRSRPPLWSLPGLGAGSTTPAPIVLISIDTLRADHVGAYGYQKVPTPNIDALARDGVLFEHAYSHAPQTLPSHVSILTGRLPFEHGVRDNIGFTVKSAERLLPQILREAGYTTAGFVSAYVLRRETGIATGFDSFDDKLQPASPEIAIGDLRRDGTATLAATDHWLDTQSSPRFFLFFHIYEPHSPYEAPERFGRYAPYDRAVAYADEIVGRLLGSLKRRGLYEPSLIVLLSDHGEGLGDHGEQEHGLFVYREAIHVPLIIKLARERSAGRRIGAAVQHIDLVPTVLDLLRLPPERGLRGRSLDPLMRGNSIADQGIYSEALYPRYHFGWSEILALTDNRYAFIKAPRNELYDLQQDPGERRNLASDRSATRSAMSAALDGMIAGTRTDAPGDVDPAVRERLRALGYVGAAPAAVTSGNGLPDPKDKVGVLERYRAALALVRRGQFEAALSAFRAIVRDNPLMADVWSEIGGLELRLGRPGNAVDAYRHLVDSAPRDPSALINVADTLLVLGRVEEARAQAALASETARDSRWRARAHQTLAMIALERRDEAGARREASQANQIDPGLPMPDYIEGLIRYRSNQFEAAIPFLQQALAKSSGQIIQIPGLRYYLGDALARVERYTEAEPLLVEETRLFPAELRAHAALGMLYRATGRTQASEREIQALERAPSEEGRVLAGELRRMFGAR